MECTRVSICRTTILLAVLQCLVHHSCCAVTYLSEACYRSEPCHSTHPTAQEIQQCSEENHFQQNSTFPGSSWNVTTCPGDGEDDCNAAVVHTEESYTFSLLDRDSLNWTFHSLNPHSFAMNVSWIHTDRTKALARSLHPLIGYQLKVKRDDQVVECLCIWEPLLSSLTLGITTDLNYSSSSSMSVHMFTLPYDFTGFNRDYYTESKCGNWPSSCNCNNVSALGSFCPPSLPTIPRDVSVFSTLSSQTKELQVSWRHPSNSPPPPQVYYLILSNGQENISYVVNGTTSALIQVDDNLNIDQNYSVQVQGYSHCSGLSAFYSGAGENVGCGLLSDPALELPFVASTFPETTTTSPSVTTASSVDDNLITDGIIVTITVVVVIVVLFIVLLVVVVIFWSVYRSHSQRATEVHEYSNLPNPLVIFHPLKTVRQTNVLVLYSFNTPVDEQERIQTFVVARLLDRKFGVKSCNDYTEKTIPQWLEMEARLARSVLIVCNKTFQTEWNAQARSSFVNSLYTIITSCVSQGIIEKYAVILLDENSRRCIPDNEYLRGMKTFVMGENMESKALEEIVNFVKRSK